MQDEHDNNPTTPDGQEPQTGANRRNENRRRRRVGQSRANTPASQPDVPAETGRQPASGEGGRGDRRAGIDRGRRGAANDPKPTGRQDGRRTRQERGGQREHPVDQRPAAERGRERWNDKYGTGDRSNAPQSRQRSDDAERNRRGRRPPLPREQRRPRRDEEAPDRVRPERQPHTPAAPQHPREGDAARGRERRGGTERERRGAGRSGRDQRAGAPPVQPATRGRLRVIPLGGVGEVGKNMTLVEYERDMILLDCGGKFPEEEQRGIDLIIPDVTYVKERLSNLRGILITHGHEDHIGGLPYILPQFKDRAPIPVYGSPLALGFIEGKLAEQRLDKLVQLHPVQPGEEVRLGQLTARFIHVTHSIPDTNAIAVTSPIGTIVDTADFKFDPTPVMGGPTDERLLRQLGDRGVLALFSDTVRVETSGSTPSERVVLEKMDEVIREAKGQVIVTTFASNISRIHMALLAAQKYGRKVAVAGRSMEQNARVALDLGYLDPPDGLLLPLDDLLKLPKHKRVLVITGSQGEAAAALSRIAAADHPKIRVGRGDVVLVSATPVPGNEETVTRTIDNLFRRGTTVVYSALDREVHVSGHAGRDELRKMIDLLRPRYVVPIHGEFRHMVLYRDLAGAAGIPPERVLLPEIGGVIEFRADGAGHQGRVPAGSILVDRLGDRGNGQVTLRDREHLADDGVVVVTIVVDRDTGKLIAGPDLVAKGLKPELRNGALREAETDLRRMLERRSKGGPQYGYLVQRAKEVVGKALYRRSKSRPMILPVVTEL